MRALLIGAFAGPLSNLVFVWLATQGHNVLALFVAIGLDNVAGGFAGTCLIAYMSSLTGRVHRHAIRALLVALRAARAGSSPRNRAASSKARPARRTRGAAPGMNNLFASYAPDNFAKALERSGVSPAALGSGYVAFFIYSALIGVFAVVLSIAVLRRQQDDVQVPGEAAERSNPHCGLQYVDHCCQRTDSRGVHCGRRCRVCPETFTDQTRDFRPR